MKTKSTLVLVSLILVISMLLAACQPAVTPTVAAEPTQPDCR